MDTYQIGLFWYIFLSRVEFLTTVHVLSTSVAPEKDRLEHFRGKMKEVVPKTERKHHTNLHFIVLHLLPPWQERRIEIRWEIFVQYLTRTTTKCQRGL